MVRYKVGRPAGELGVSKSMECDIFFPSVFSLYSTRIQTNSESTELWCYINLSIIIIIIVKQDLIRMVELCANYVLYKTENALSTNDRYKYVSK